MKNKQEIGTKKKGKTQGGKFLGKGAYGCVFSPPVPCENKALNEHIKKNAKGVGKIFQDPYKAENEMASSYKFSTIDPEGLYLVPLVGNCKVTKSDIINSDKDYNMCEFTKRSNPKLKGYLKKFNPLQKPDKRFVQLIYKYKCIALDQFLFNDPSKNSMFMNTYLDYIINLAKGIKLLQTNGYAHMDIKPDNVIIINKDTHNENMLLIDLGLADKFNTIYQLKLSKHVLYHNSTHYPPEFQIYTYFMELAHDNTLMELIEILKLSSNHEATIEEFVTQEPYKFYSKMYSNKRFVRRNTSWNKEFKVDYSLQIQDFMEEILRNINSHRDRLRTQSQLQSYITNLFKLKYSKLVDVFQLGGVIKTILLFTKKTAKINIYQNNIYNRLMALSNRMYNFNPNLRFTIHQVLDELSEIRSDFFKSK